MKGRAVPERVEVRWRAFQLVTNVAFDERTTLALVHIAAGKVRFAWRTRDYPESWGRAAGFLGFLRSQLRGLRKRVATMPATAEGLEAIGRKGMARIGFYWSDVIIGATAFPAKNFAALLQDTPLVACRLHRGGAS